MANYAYKHVKDYDQASNDNKRLPPQLVTILGFIKTAGNINQDVLVTQLADGNKLNTRQPVERVINFYHSRMTELKLVEVTRIAGPAKEPKQPKAKETVVVGAPAGTVPPAAGPTTQKAKAVV